LENNMKSADFIRESELDQIVSQSQPTQKPSLAPRVIGAIGKGIGGALSGTADAIAAAPSSIPSRGTFYRPGKPLPGTTSVIDPESNDSSTISTAGVAVSRPDVTNMRKYAQQVSKGQKAKNSTGTPEIDALLKQLGLM
jgi:hypothetical protein